MNKKIIGIISWLPDGPNRDLRWERITRLLKRIEELWPTTDILIITQNWKTFEMPELKNKIIRKDYKNGLGILGARKTLRKEFLKLNYKWLIMFDDDALIEEVGENGAQQFMDIIDKQTAGFGYFHKAAQLNGAVISKELYTKEPMVEIDAQKGEGYEDSIYTTLLENKYPDKQFKLGGINCIQFQNTNEPARSTWWDDCQRKTRLGWYTQHINNYIRKYKKFPDNWRELFIHPDDQPTTTYLGQGNHYYGL